MFISASEEWFSGGRRVPVGVLPVSVPVSHGRVPVSAGRGFFFSSLPGHRAPSLGIGGPVSPSGHGAVYVSKPRPSTLQDVAQALGQTKSDAHPSPSCSMKTSSPSSAAEAIPVEVVTMGTDWDAMLSPPSGGRDSVNTVTDREARCSTLSFKAKRIEPS
ncbi:hypothetical protein EYF80_033600 [Liparis tanakae]|uniref:Uncharacterized protein n=1 Tax=Liparis tanakae TaxID=230148 RepID=A0A4Z2GUE6_9TELE|nr:hypothetical protein EYF80_033600 [Liparis tanakae]